MVTFALSPHAWNPLSLAEARSNTHFSNCAMPVDVFHFKCKHKESNQDCGQYCHPILWLQHCGEDGKWWFNSLKAEQRRT
jgi:hypothetical protein